MTDLSILSDAELENNYECYSYCFSKHESQCMACLIRNRCINLIATKRLSEIKKELGARADVGSIAEALNIDTSTVISVILPVSSGASIDELLPAEALTLQKIKRKAPRIIEETKAKKKRAPKIKVETRKAPRISAVEMRVQWERERKRSALVGKIAIGSILKKLYCGVYIEVVYNDGFVFWNGEEWPSLSSVMVAIVGKKPYPTQAGSQSKTRKMSNWSVPRFFNLKGN